MNSKIFASLLIAQTAVFAYSEVKKLPEMAVTANRTETELSKVNRSITVITSEEIEQKKAKDLVTLLAQVPGIDVKRTGVKSRNTAVFIRGMESYHTKLMIDGVVLQRTGNIGKGATPVFPFIPLDHIERIEIIRGGASTLYGSNAIGGVINIITKKAEEHAFSGEVDAMVNAHGDQEYSTFINGRKGKFDYNFGVGWLNEDSLSAKKDNNEKDPQRALNLNGTLGYQLSDQLKLTLFGTYEDGDSEFDDGDWHIQNSQIGARLDADNLFNKLLDTSIRYAFTENVQNDRDSRDSFSSQTQEIDWQNTLKLNEYNRFILGLTYTDESGVVDTPPSTNIDKSYWTQAYFAQYEFEPIDNLLLDAGLRYNNHSLFGGETTYSASASYYIEGTGTKLRTSWNTGYRAPSFYELYSSAGNLNLEPETSESWDIGFEQEVGDKLTFGVTYFTNRVTNYIDYSGSSYNQIDGIKVYGFESFIDYKATEDLTFNISHTYQHCNNMEKDVAYLINRPENKLSASINWSVTDRLNLNLNGIFVDERYDYGWPDDKKLPSYTLLNIAASYEVSEALQLYGKIDNLLDEDYEEVSGYETHGIMPYIGLKYRF